MYKNLRKYLSCNESDVIFCVCGGVDFQSVSFQNRISYSAYFLIEKAKVSLSCLAGFFVPLNTPFFCSLGIF